jgi:HD-like signal output (HDOD) protein
MAISQNDAVRQIVSLHEVPTLPEVMTRVLQTLEDQASSAEDVTEIMAADPVITARVLRLANSAFFGSRFEIDSIHRAVVTVGFEAVKQLALATSVLDSVARKHQRCLDPEEFWLLSLGTAKAGQLLAFSVPHISMPEACFTAGLLRNLGTYILSLSLQDQYSAVLAEAAEIPEPLHQTERRHLNTDHAEVGAWLAQHWNFPEVIVASVQHTHHPTGYKGPYRKEVVITALANEMARLASFGHAGDPQPPTLREDYIQFLELEGDQVQDLCEALAELRDDGRVLLGLLREP